jgi:hypothetical protein
MSRSAPPEVLRGFGGCIVAEVLIGILKADRASYLASEPSWTPTLPARGARFGLTDLLLATDAQ